MKPDAQFLEETQKAFAAGADIKEMAEATSIEMLIKDPVRKMGQDKKN